MLLFFIRNLVFEEIGIRKKYYKIANSYFDAMVMCLELVNE